MPNDRDFVVVDRRRRGRDRHRRHPPYFWFASFAATLILLQFGSLGVVTLGQSKKEKEDEASTASASASASGQCRRQGGNGGGTQCEEEKEEEENGTSSNDTVFDVFGKWVNDITNQGEAFLKEHVLNQKEGHHDDDRDPFGHIFGQEKQTTNTNTETSGDHGDDDVGASSSSDDDDAAASAAADSSEKKKDNPFQWLGDMVKDLFQDASSSKTTTDGGGGDDGDRVEEATKTTKPSSSSSSSSGVGFGNNDASSSFDRILQQAREYNLGESSSSSSSSSRKLNQVLDQFIKSLGEVQIMVDQAFGHVDLAHFHPFGLWYYVEFEDSVKTPSWKRIQHRYHKRIQETTTSTNGGSGSGSGGGGIVVMEELHDALYLCQLSYAPKVDIIRDGLRNFQNDAYELMYARTESLPAEPGHFLAVQKESTREEEGEEGRNRPSPSAGGGTAAAAAASTTLQNLLSSASFPWNDDGIASNKMGKTSGGTSASTLDIILVVRGTMELGDFVSDALLEAIDFDFDLVESINEEKEDLKKNGEEEEEEEEESDRDDETDDSRKGRPEESTRRRAHAGIARAGRYIYETHISALEELHLASGRDKLRVTLLGHSLGAGAAAIATLLFHRNHADFLDVTSIGFGCPAVLDLATSEAFADRITTVVTDADIIPRMSGATIANLLLDVMSFDWTSKGLRDVRQFLDHAVETKMIPFLNPDVSDRIVRWVNDTMDREDRPHFRTVPAERMEPVLFPPGQCIHLFRDGSAGAGFTGTYTPCRFFDEVEMSRTLLDDHMIPTGYHRAMLDWMRHVRQNLNYDFPHDLMALPV